MKLDERMKEQYENRTRFMLPRRTYTIVRCDGRAFHTWTRNLQRPYDLRFMSCMAQAALKLCEQAAGAQFGYVQSDEISVLLTDFERPETAAWFDGNLQKLCSISASIVTAAFNHAVRQINLTNLPGLSELPEKLAYFDARVFVIPDPVEVENYFIWRQQDAERNSVAMLAQSHYSQRELNGKSVPQQHDMIHAAGDNWNNHPARFKRGTGIIYQPMTLGIFRSNWADVEVPIFTAERDWLTSRVPRQWPEDIPPKEESHGDPVLV